MANTAHSTQKPRHHALQAPTPRPVLSRAKYAPLATPVTQTQQLIPPYAL